MVRIRLRRVGGKKQPSYRVVAADKESPRDGRFLEILGFYNPRTEPATIKLNEERIYHWLSNGAQPSDAVVKLFDTMELTERYQRYKEGEKLEKLLKEAAAFDAARIVDPKTHRETPTKKTKKEKAEPEIEPEPEAS